MAIQSGRCDRAKWRDPRIKVMSAVLRRAEFQGIARPRKILLIIVSPPQSFFLLLSPYVCEMSYPLPQNTRQNPRAQDNLPDSTRKDVVSLAASRFLDQSPQPPVETLSKAVFAYVVRMDPKTFIDHPRASQVLSPYAINGLRRDIANGLAGVSSFDSPTSII